MVHAVPSTTISQSGFSRKFNPWHLTIASLFLLIFCFSFRKLNDFDLGFHLKGGQWILQNHHVPAQDIYTYTVSNHDYLDIQWLYQVGLYLVYRVGGYPLLTILNVCLVTVFFFMTYKRVRETGAPLGICLLILFLSILACEIRFRVRPEILSWILLSSSLWILELWRLKKRDWLNFLPLIHLIWVNVEGLFFLGLLFIFFYLISGFLKDSRPDKKLSLVFIASIFVSFMNPYGYRGALFPWKLFTNIGSSGAIKNGISEFQSPWSFQNSNIFSLDWTFWSYFFFFLLLAFFFLLTLRERKLHEFLIVGSSFYLSTIAQRNIPIFLLSCVPVAASCWNNLDHEWAKSLQRKLLSKPLMAWLLAVFALGLSMRVWTGAYYVSERRFERFGLGIDQDQIPVRAVEYLNKNGLDGRILNHFNFGGWLDWQGPPGKTFIDGRLEVMGERFYSEYRAYEAPGGLAQAIAKYDPQVLFFNPDHAYPWLQDLQKMLDWRPVYLDETGVIFLHKGFADTIPTLDDMAVFKARNLPAFTHQDAVNLLSQSPPSALAGFFRDFVEPTRYSQGLTTLADYYFYSGRFDFAEEYFLSNIQRTEGRYFDLIFNLGNMYFRTGRNDVARLCMERALEEKPNLIQAKVALDRLGP